MRGLFLPNMREQAVSVLFKVTVFFKEVTDTFTTQNNSNKKIYVCQIYFAGN